MDPNPRNWAELQSLIQAIYRLKAEGDKIATFLAASGIIKGTKFPCVVQSPKLIIQPLAQLCF